MDSIKNMCYGTLVTTVESNSIHPKTTVFGRGAFVLSRKVIFPSSRDRFLLSVVGLSNDQRHIELFYICS